MDRRQLGGLVVGIVAIVTVLFVFVVMVDVFDRSYDPPPVVYALMTTVVGAVLTVWGTRSKTDDRDWTKMKSDDGK